MSIDLLAGLARAMQRVRLILYTYRPPAPRANIALRLPPAIDLVSLRGLTTYQDRTEGRAELCALSMKFANASDHGSGRSIE